MSSQIPLNYINVRRNKEYALLNGEMYLNISPAFQREYESWSSKLQTGLIETMLLGRQMNPIWTVTNDQENSEEVLDGMHRLTTALNFLENKFSLNKNYLQTLDPEKYGGKYLNNLELDDQTKIRKYNFIFNQLDSSYRNDPDKLKEMYGTLNRSSVALNDYEFNKVIYNDFYSIFIEFKENFVNTTFFDKIEDKRGRIDEELMDMFALSISPLPNSWSSIKSLRDKWIKENIGDKYEEVTEYLSNNTDIIKEKLKFMLKIINVFYELNLLKNDEKQKTNFIIYKFIISRCCYFMKNISSFNRIAEKLKNDFENEIFLTDILVNRNRNAIFQREIIELIDDIITKHFDRNEHRLFDKKEIERKLKEQDFLCAICEEIIKETDKFDGDHILPWTNGGKTSYDNLQVVHRRCHRKKN